MTTEEIRVRVREIAAAQEDSERAHRLEDALRRDFILHVAAEATDKRLRTRARHVLSTDKIAFERWFA
jgi:hypothetical protein